MIAEKKAKKDMTLIEKMGQDAPETKDRVASRFVIKGDDAN